MAINIWGATHVQIDITEKESFASQYSDIQLESCVAFYKAYQAQPLEGREALRSKGVQIPSQQQYQWAKEILAERRAQLKNNPKTS